MELSLYDEIQQPIILCDKSGAISYFNHSCVSYFKLAPRKLKTCSITDLLEFGEFQFLAFVSECLKSKKSIVSEELDSVLKHDTEQTLSFVLKVIPHEGQCIIAINDLSSEKRLYEKYKKQVLDLKETHGQIILADKLTALGEMTAGITHEISNPLTVMANRVQHLRLKLDLEAKESEERSALDDIDNCLRRINQIMVNLQSVVGNKEGNFSIISLEDVLEKSMSFINEVNFAQDIEIKTEVNDDQLVLANDGKLQQVLVNLIKNAVDALNTHGSSKITIEIGEDIDKMSSFIKIRDNGCGVSKEIEESIFDMFYTTKDVGEGTGLGLAISAKIIQSFHGELTLEDNSEHALENGACFCIYLPTLEMLSFSQTNKYLEGLTEDEQDPIVVYGQNIEILNDILFAMHEHGITSVFTNKKENIVNLEKFFAPRFILDFENNLTGDDYFNFLNSPDQFLKDLGNKAGSNE